jgi:hypothetical protein
MKAKTYVERKIKILAEKYPEAEFRYEYRINTQTHIIEVLPQLFFDENENYLVDESIIEKDFENKYLSENILFISLDSLTKIHKVDLDLTNKDKKLINLKSILDKEIELAECWIDYDVAGYRAIINAMKIACELCIDICTENVTLDDNDDVDKKSILITKAQINNNIK